MGQRVCHASVERVDHLVEKIPSDCSEGATSKALKRGCSRAGGSRKKLAELLPRRSRSFVATARTGDARTHEARKPKVYVEAMAGPRAPTSHGLDAPRANPGAAQLSVVDVFRIEVGHRFKGRQWDHPTGRSDQFRITTKKRRAPLYWQSVAKALCCR